MKTKFFSVLAVAGLFFLASCGGGVSEETKKAVASTDSAMTAMMTDVETFSAEVGTALANCNTSCTGADSVAATVKPAWKGKCLPGNDVKVVLFRCYADRLVLLMSR